MKRSIVVLALFAAAALVAAPAAQAKGPINKLQVCGSDGCATVLNVSQLSGPTGLDQLFGMALTTTPSPGPYYSIRASMPEGGVYTTYYLAGGVIASQDGGWGQLDPTLATQIDAAAASLTPYRQQISRVAVNGKLVSDIGPYQAIMGSLRPAGVSNAAAQAASHDWVVIDLRTTRPTPWSVGGLQAFYDPAHDAVQVSGSAWLTPTDTLREAIRNDAGLSSGGGGDGGIPAPALWIGLPLLALIAVATALELRRRARPRPAPVA